MKKNVHYWNVLEIGWTQRHRRYTSGTVPLFIPHPSSSCVGFIFRLALPSWKPSLLQAMPFQCSKPHQSSNSPSVYSYWSSYEDMPIPEPIAKAQGKGFIHWPGLESSNGVSLLDSEWRRPVLSKRENECWAYKITHGKNLHYLGQCFSKCGSYQQQRCHTGCHAESLVPLPT